MFRIHAKITNYVTCKLNILGIVDSEVLLPILEILLFSFHSSKYKCSYVLVRICAYVYDFMHMIAHIYT